jgi:NADPH:quinone reductase-like Zn-dependent oxidoreductase
MLVAMRAAIIRRYGPPDVFEIGEVDRPTAGPTQLLVRVRASSVNPVDCAIRSGVLRFFIRHELPKVLGIDYAGVVEAVGSDVKGFAPGDEVFGFIDIRTCGAYAEHAAVEASSAANKPANVSWEAAGVSGGAGLTAYQALVDVLRVRAGEKLLVNGAGGGVGTFTVQIAKALGCHVTAVGSAAKRELLLELGADAVVDYAEQDPFAGRGVYDAIADCVGNLGVLAARRMLVSSGRHVVIAARPVIFLRAALAKVLPGKPFQTMSVEPRGRDGEVLARWLGTGEVRAIVDRTWPLDALAEAHAYVERGRTAGKVAISIGV